MMGKRTGRASEVNDIQFLRNWTKSGWRRTIF